VRREKFQRGVAVVQAMGFATLSRVALELGNMRMRWIVVSALIGFATFFGSPPAAAAQDIAVVVSSANPVTNLSLGELRKIFSGDKHTWSGGQPIKLIVRSPGCLERLALLKLLSMSESEYKQYWSGQLFRGEALSDPVTVPSLGMQIESLKVFPGAISLVVARDVRTGIKMIKIDGRLPGETGYPIH
jgi:hypothetical protein